MTNPELTVPDPFRKSRASESVHIAYWPFIIAMIAGLLCAALYVFAYGGPLEDYRFPGIGITLLSWLILAAGIIICRPRFSIFGVLLLVASIFLSACYGLFGSRSMKLLNLPVLLMTVSLALQHLAGHTGPVPLSAYSLWKAFSRTICAQFSSWHIPFIIIRQRRKTGIRLRYVAGGLMLSVLALAVALPLLCSADNVFADTLFSIWKPLLLENTPTTVFRILHTLILGMLLSSALYALSQPSAAEGIHTVTTHPRTPFLILLIVLCTVYAVFDYIQVLYLCGVLEGALPLKGYAEYARSGFFQLVAIATIDLLVFSLTRIFTQSSRLLDILCAILLVLTAVMLFSAIRRMQLFISAFGLSILRLLTLWAMAMIAAELILSIARLLNPRLRIFQILAALTICTWIVLNYLNVDALVARYNVTAYEQGRLEHLDTEYLRTLSADVVAYFDAEDYLAFYGSAEDTPWFCWDASLLRL